MLPFRATIKVDLSALPKCRAVSAFFDVIDLRGNPGNLLLLDWLAIDYAVSPQALGVTAQELAEMDSLLQSFIDDKKVSGMAILDRNNGNQLYPDIINALVNAGQ